MSHPINNAFLQVGSLCPTQQRSNFEGLEAVGGTGPGAPCSDNRGGSQTRRCTGTRFALGVGSFPLRYRLSEPRKSRKKKKKSCAGPPPAFQTWAEHRGRAATRCLAARLPTAPTGRPRPAHLGPQRRTPDKHHSAVPARPRRSPVKPVIMGSEVAFPNPQAQKSSTLYSQQPRHASNPSMHQQRNG